VQTIFLTEAILLTMTGGVAGLLFGLLATLILRLVIPQFPAGAPIEYVVAALFVSALAGVLSGVGPARRASELTPVDALRAD
jgi:putative ABC transport system permease protein